MLEVTYLDHSGFVVQTKDHVLVFDYYRDPADKLTALLEENKSFYVFSSHAHADHFNPVIINWPNVKKYFLSSDIVQSKYEKLIKDNHVVAMTPYETWSDSDIKVTTYGSTDEGLSFLVDIAGCRIFHAGDLNWWHWKGDTVENQYLAENSFKAELAKLQGLSIDVAFFPVDSRLEEYSAIGIEALCQAVNVKQLIVMHTCGQSWAPSTDFCIKHQGTNVWCPAVNGEKHFFSKT